ncbi:hypothetical protein [Pseudomonas sp. PNPG3]|uniref:hypothetical protein n=1 Tax=Pseudomonas sp. PNPG3 TaxID=2919497 RepID=UPI001FFCD2CC|nr:hypothetical protein [Pseudomonas sp. PNPG3]MCK2122164.1 hypothetical protein [Pseudomonas sp. PNPG3]
MGHPLPSQDPATDIASCVLVPIPWLKHGVELLQEHGESGPTVQKLSQRASEWERHKAPGRRQVKLSEQRAEFEKAHPVPDMAFWSEAECTYVAVKDCPEQHAVADRMNTLYAGFLLRARTPEGL